MSIFFIQLPPFVIITKQITVYRVSEIIIAFLFFVIIIIKKTKLNLPQSPSLLISLFFFSQSLSIINTIDFKSFLFRYEILIFFYLIYICLNYYLNKPLTKKLVNLTIYFCLMQIFFELIFLISPSNIKLFITSFLHPEASEIIIFNMRRNRIYLEHYLFLFIPILLYKLTVVKTFLKKIYYLLLVFLIFFLSLTTGFRIYFLLSLAGLSWGFYLFKKIGIFKKKFFFIWLTFLGLFFIHSSFFNKSDLFRRMLLLKNEQELSSIIGRVEMWKNAFYLGISHIFFGVGLGNYFLYQSEINKLKYSLGYKFLKNSTLQVFDDPHNIFLSIFSQSGILGLISFLILIIKFLKDDLISLFLFINKKNKSILDDSLILKINVIISFWLLMIYLTVNPFNTIRSVFYFILFRSLIIKVK